MTSLVQVLTQFLHLETDEIKPNRVLTRISQSEAPLSVTDRVSGARVDMPRRSKILKYLLVRHLTMCAPSNHKLLHINQLAASLINQGPGNGGRNMNPRFQPGLFLGSAG